MNLVTWIVLIAIVLLILAFGLFVLFHKKDRLSPNDQKKVKSLWEEIVSLRSAHPEQAILKADKLLDFVLGKAGFTGSLGEKMKAARSVFSDNNAIWSAHKLRNRIAHDVDVQMSPAQAKAALKAFRKSLSDLNVKL